MSSNPESGILPVMGRAQPVVKQREVESQGPALRVVPRPTKRQQHLEVVRQASEDPLARKYAPCRSWGHRWGRHQVGAEQYGSVTVSSSCSECGKYREREVSRSGRTTPWRYRDPENYRRSGDDRLSRQEWISTWFVGVMGTP